MSPPPSLGLLPAVDVAGGRAVRVVRGEGSSATAYGDPLRAALGWQHDGATWVHLVDLDAAFGRGSNQDLLASIVGRLDVAVQLSGGISNEETLAAALATGCARVNLSTAAVKDLSWVAAAAARYGDRVAVGLDVRGTALIPRGVADQVGELVAVLDDLDTAGAARYIVTDVARDGSLAGPNLDLLRAVCARTDRPVVASGGIGSLGDIVALRALVPLGVEAAILGQALYTGALTLPAALRAASWAAEIDT